MKIQEMLFTGVGVLRVSKVEVLVDDIDLNCWRKRKERRTQTRFPILMCRDSRYGQTGATCCERKGPTAHSISLLVGFIKDLVFRRIILKCDNEPSTKSVQDAVVHAFAGVEVIPQGPPEGDHMANGRVEMAVREAAEHNTGVCIADDSPLLSWLRRFALEVMNKMRIGQDGKTSELRRTGRRCFVKLEKTVSAHLQVA